MNTLYLANPYGFSLQQREHLLPELIHTLEGLGATVWEPFQRSGQFASAGDAAYRIARSDLQDVHRADGFFAVVNGSPPDEGVMVELGLAIAWEKPIFLFRDDFRRATDSSTYPLNLMIFAGLPQDNWEAHWYQCIGDLGDPSKALGRWLAGEPDYRPSLRT